MKSLVAGLLVLVAACAREGPPRDPYVVSVDVGPHIRAFGEETITADEAGEHLTLLGPTVVPALAAALEREPKDVRVKAIEVLATIGSPDAVPALVRTAQHDDDVDVRGDALRALGAIGDPGGLPVVEEGLRDVRLGMRAGAVMACASLCTKPDTVDRLVVIALRDPDISVALAARSSLTALRARDAAIDAVVTASLDRHATAADPPDQRALAALLRSDLSPSTSIDGLVAACAAASPPLQRQIAWRLATIGDERAVPALAALLDGSDPVVRPYAWDALARLRDRGVTSASDPLARYTGQRPMGALTAPEF